LSTFGHTLNRFIRNIVSIAIVLLAGISFAHANNAPIHQSDESNSFSSSDVSSFISNSNGATVQRDFGSHKSYSESFELIEESDEDESYKKHIKELLNALVTVDKSHFAVNFFVNKDIPVSIYTCELHAPKRSILFQVFRI
jgi:hypothetical protein